MRIANTKDRTQALALFDRHMPMAVRVARTWAERHNCWRHRGEDLVQVALMGLWTAVQKVDAAADAPQVAVYLRRAIHGKIVDHMRSDNGTIRLPRTCDWEDRTVKVQTLSFWGRQGPQNLDSRHRRCRRPLTAEVRDAIGGFDNLPWSDREDFDSLTQCLSDRDRQMFWLYYGEGVKLKEVGRRFGISESRAWQVLADGVGRVRQLLIDRARRDAS